MVRWDETGNTSPKASGVWTAFRRTLVPDGPLSRRVAASGTLPPLPPGRPTLLSVVVADRSTWICEVKVDGVDWAPSTLLFAGPPRTGPGAVLLRELAVLIPQA